MDGQQEGRKREQHLSLHAVRLALRGEERRGEGRGGETARHADSLSEGDPSGGRRGFELKRATEDGKNKDGTERGGTQSKFTYANGSERRGRGWSIV